MRVVARQSKHSIFSIDIIWLHLAAVLLLILPKTREASTKMETRKDQSTGKLFRQASFHRPEFFLKFTWYYTTPGLQPSVAGLALLPSQKNLVRNFCHKPTNKPSQLSSLTSQFVHRKNCNEKTTVTRASKRNSDCT